MAPSSPRNWFEAVTNRRSTYTLSKESPIPDSELQHILETALEQVPSSFGTFTTRMVLLVKEEHQRLWNTIIEIVKAITPPEKWEAHTSKRMEGFLNSYGTILFLEDPENTRKMQDAMPAFCEHFQNWARETNAMHQYAVWTALTDQGFGVNLQHYNPLIDEKVKQTWNIPGNWTLFAEMTFGLPTKPPAPKSKQFWKPTSERLFIHGF